MVSDEKLTEIREKIPISGLIADYVQLKRSGKSLKGLCPFHQEKTPSFYVNDERESFHCFGCGTGGDLFEFIGRIEGISFPEAIERLAERAGVELGPISQVNPERQQKRRRALDLVRHAAWYYHCLLKKLPEDHEAWLYLKERQIPTETCENFFLGYCPHQDSGLKTYLIEKGFQALEIQEANLFRSRGEFFRGRLIFPIFRADKKVVGFGGRLMDSRNSGPKYLNSAESEIYKKSELCYGFDQAKNAIRKTGQVLIAEGYFDVLALHAHGLNHAVAPLGTALTAQQAKTLQRMADKIILIFDGDSAGNQAAFRALEVLLSLGHFPHRCLLPEGEDPDSFLKRYGRLALEKKLQGSRNLLEDLIDKGASQVQGLHVGLDQKGQVAGQLKALIDKIPDGISAKLYRRRLAEALEVPESWIEKPRHRPNSAPEAPKRALDVGWLPEEEILLEIWLKFGSLRRPMQERLEPHDFCTKNARFLADAFWDLARRQPEVSTGKYFDLAPTGLAEVLRELAIRSNGLEEEETAKLTLEEASLRLKEKKLRSDLRALKGNAETGELSLIQEKIKALSQVIKDKARSYGQG